MRRKAERGRYDQQTLYSILDEGFVCHLGFESAHGPVVLPTAYGRAGDVIYVHGAAGNAALKTLRSGAPVCLTVTLVDGLVLARSGFHSSINYRSAVVFGSAREVTDKGGKHEAMHTIIEHVLPGRDADLRPVTDAEYRATRVLAIPIRETSAKIRTGGPQDDPEDVELPIWAGVVPLRVVASPPITADDVMPGTPTPRYASRYRRPGTGGPPRERGV